MNNNKNIIKKIAWNCQKATYLIEKKQLGPITLWEHVELKIHLAGCSVCRLYEQQSIQLNQTVRNFFHQPEYQNLKLDEHFKEELQERTKEELNKNK
ncbi:MAG: hypothetical protein AVDCRST_MAG95-3534 [uncultured Adhaeribacter sp.]|uniref:Zinc-finger domain-containing protein n=1 Tax=uncultured Adhaeribacter sp. TaxID=448109 RepID=A0A6J4JPW0_9BACT|nr:MAG: hypothetical protein AVDCRST_MAG95-3534 [uncultured Adhaeribacter sp.]